MKRTLICLIFILGVILTSFAQAESGKPNILVIWGDDIGQSNIGAYTFGLVGYRTPNIDQVMEKLKTSGGSK